MLTNSFVVFLLNYLLEASFVVVPLGAPGLEVWLFQCWPSQLPSFWTFWSDFPLKPTLIPKKCVEDLHIFRDWATQMRLDFWSLAYANCYTLFFLYR